MTHPDWALGFEDEVWWSRLARPALHSWAERDRPLRLVEQAVANDDPTPKALACYGLLVRWWDQQDRPPHEQAWLRFVDGRPVSGITTQFLAWCCAKLEAAGKTALLLVWDNVSADEKVGATWRYLLVSGSDVRTAKGSWEALKALGSR